MTDLAPCRVLIVDDEPLARRRLRRLLEGRPGVEIVGEAGDGRSAVEAVQTLRPDLLFLDVQMPHLDGFGVLAELTGTEVCPVVVFVTAHDRYTLEAFEVRAIDYLLKPFEDERFEQALAAARERLVDSQARRLWEQLTVLAGERLEPREAIPESPAAAGSTPVRRFAVTKRGHTLLLPVDDVEWIEADGAYVRLHLHDGANHLLRDRLKRLDRVLDPEAFVRVHRSAIVRKDRVRELHPLFHGEYELRLASGARVRLSRTYRDALHRLYN